MQKFAQKRSLRNKLRESTNITGRWAEKYFDPELIRVMDSLRKIDNDIRSITLGQQVDNGDPGSIELSLKSLIKTAKTNLNRRQYMLAISDLGKFHKKCSEIHSAASKFKIDLNKVHEMFLFKKLDDKRKESLKDLHERLAFNTSNYILKSAGLMDFFVNNFSTEGRALAAWEARYPKKVGELKEACLTIFNSSQSLFDNLIKLLSEMAIARADRKPDDFEKNLAQFNKDYSKYDLIFRELYNKVLRPLINDSELFVEKKVEEAKDAGNYQKPDDAKLPAVPDLEVYEQSQHRAPSGHQGIPEFRKQFPAAAKVDSEPGTHKDMSVVPGKSPSQYPATSKDISVAVMPSERESKPFQPVTRPIDSPQTMRSPIMEGVKFKPSLHSVKEVELNTEKSPGTTKDPNILDEHLQKIRESYENPANSNRNPAFTQISPGNQSSPTLNPSAHSKFLNSLESFSGESSLILSSYIKKYAIAIQESDPESSIKLFQIVNSIKG